MSQIKFTPAERVRALERLGYTEREAQFLCLAALHGGYFLRRQYVQFLAKAVGGTAAGLIEKVLAKGHAKGTTYAGGTNIYHLYSRPFYAALGQEDNRNRRLRQPVSIKAKLMGLDFVLAHPHVEYLATEEEKMDYFLRELALDPLLLPAVRYANGGKLTQRYFVEKFPIFLANTPAPAAAPVVSFCFVDEGAVGTSAFMTFLRKYAPLWASVPQFQLIYVAASDVHFEAAARMFAGLLGQKEPAAEAVSDPWLHQLTQHFETRKLFEARQWNSFDRAKLIRFRDDCGRFPGPKFDVLYRQWITEGEAGLRRLLGPKPTSGASMQGTFSTYLLRENYELFGIIAA